MIVCGFPGIGKTSICKGGNGFIDLDSSMFRHPSGNVNVDRYIDVALALSNQGHTVFVSTHHDVIDEIFDRMERSPYKFAFAIVYPIPGLHEEWSKRMLDRYFKNGMNDTDKRAFDFVLNHYGEAVHSLMAIPEGAGAIHIKIDRIDYNLEKLLRSYSITKYGEGVVQP